MALESDIPPTVLPTESAPPPAPIPPPLAPVATPPHRLMRQYELVERVKAYEPDADEELLNRAYVFSMQAHGSQLRASGDPYFSHPLEVSGILTGMRMDAITIATALLHDTVEDTAATLADIEGLFGHSVARLVDGVTKLSRIEFQNDHAAKQAENFRKLILAMSEDIRVLLVKLADRLHNMRTLGHISNPDKRLRIAHETMDIYAPLAERIGIKQMQEELQDLGFAEIHPEERNSIMVRLGFLRGEGGDLVTKIQDELRKVMVDADIKAEITGREKTPYSIWRKMKMKEIGFEQLSDIMAFRIIVDTVEQCYQTLGIIHSHYPVVPGRFKDYISTPKPNRYQSLHTALIGPMGHRIEIQIRTHAMHEVARLGVAAHWVYKQGEIDDNTQQYRWLRELLDIVKHAQKPEEFLEHTRLELFQDQVFCFSPKGNLIALPGGSTPIDFAYAVHSDVGDTCCGAKVNGRMVPLRTVLKNGDQVDVLTQKGGTPSPEWERFVVSGKARARIRRAVRNQQRGENITIGRAAMTKICRQEGMEFTEKLFDPVLQHFQAATLEDLLANVGAGLQSPRDVLYAAFPKIKSRAHAKAVEAAAAESMANTAAAAHKAKEHRAAAKDDQGIITGLMAGMAFRFARCCHPLPGDQIVGIVATGRGITIHTRDCQTLDSFRNTPERWVDVGWRNTTVSHHHNNDGKSTVMPGRLSVVLSNQSNSLGTLTTIIGKGGGNVMNLKITNRSTDFFDLLVDVEVRDIRHLTDIIAALRANSAISSVSRTVGR